MFRACFIVFAAVLLGAATAGNWKNLLHAGRASPGDLEVGGELASVPAGETRFVRYEELLQLPQETYEVADDSNFRGKTSISGVALSVFAEALGKSADMIVAICNDQYRTNYPADYVAAHHPILVLRINGQERNRWPDSAEGGSMTPYLISHPQFKPSFKVLSHEDEPQIPYGVVKIEFRKEAEVFGAIRPPGEWKTDSPAGMGYVIARQDCFRCHNRGTQGGTMADWSWVQPAETAQKYTARFRAVIRNPAAVTAGAKMPGQPGYDDATLDALTAYFKTFADHGAHAEKSAEKDSTP
jgi:mono/diheme cytochrome c family protein